MGKPRVTLTRNATVAQFIARLAEVGRQTRGPITVEVLAGESKFLLEIRMIAADGMPVASPSRLKH